MAADTVDPVEYARTTQYAATLANPDRARTTTSAVRLSRAEANALLDATVRAMAMEEWEIVYDYREAGLKGSLVVLLARHGPADQTRLAVR